MGLSKSLLTLIHVLSHASLGLWVTPATASHPENYFSPTCRCQDEVHILTQTPSRQHTFEESVAEGGLSNYLRCQTHESPLISVCYCHFGDVAPHFWCCVLSVCARPLRLLLQWSTERARLARGKKNMLTLSTDLEHRSITDMAAVLWQATEVRAPIRSSGRMAVVNAWAQSVDVILSS